jgi:hypothetical protein
MTAARTTITILICATLGTILKLTLFPAVPSFEPIPISEPFPDFEDFVVDNLAYEEEYEPSWDFQRSSFSAKQIVWMVVGGLYFSLISIPISLVYHMYLGDRHNETDTEQESSDIRMLLQEGERLRLELKTMVALEKQAESHRQAQFLKEIDSMRNMTKDEEKQCVEFQNEMDSMKLLMKVRTGRHTHFQNAMEAAKNMINMERKRCTKFWDDMNSMKMTLRRSLSMSQKETVRHPASRWVRAR